MGAPCVSVGGAARPPLSKGSLAEPLARVAFQGVMMSICLCHVFMCGIPCFLRDGAFRPSRSRVSQDGRSHSPDGALVRAGRRGSAACAVRASCSFECVACVSLAFSRFACAGSEMYAQCSRDAVRGS